MTSDDNQNNGQNLTQSEINARDFAAEIASSGDGARINRFLTGDRDPATIRKKDEQRSRDQLLTMLNAAASAEQIEAARQALYDLQDRLDQEFAELEEMRDDLEARTVTLDDGTAVYRMADGRFATADGQVVGESELPANIPDNAATVEEREAYLRRAKQLGNIQNDVITAGHETLNKDGVTVGEIKEIEDDIEDALKVLDHDAPPADQKPETPNPDPQPTANPALNAPSF